MAVIKSQNAQTLLKDAVVLDLGDLRRQAAALQQAAQAQARRIIVQAQEEAARLTAGAHAKGFEKGLREGLDKGTQQGLTEGRKQGHAQALEQTSAQVQQLQQAWIAAAGAWDAQRQEMDRQARSAVLDLALALAEKIVHRTVHVDRGVVVDQVAAAMNCLLRPMDVTVRIHPADREILQEAMPGLLAQFPQFRHVHLLEDAAVGRGGCVLTHGQGQIDARVQTQLSRIAELLLPEPETPTNPALDRAGSDSASPAPREDGTP